MGIPLYFRFLTQKYPDIIIDLDKFSGSITELYYDLNGLIHPACSNTRSRQSVSNIDISRKSLEKEMHIGVIKKIEQILHLIKPTRLAALYVDGVAPLAKINQQRSRRYKSHILSTMINKVKEKHGKPIDNWNTNAISPGTKFMNGLMELLESYVTNKNKDYDINKDSKQPFLDLSTSNIPGEGEHKILKKIRSSDVVSSPDRPYNRVIYGLDADLIMLSLISGKKDIYLLRESVHFGKIKEDEFLLLNIDLLRKCLISEVKGYLPYITLSDSQIIQDYLLMCFMIGNDFIPHLPSLHIGEGSIDFVLEAYAEVFNKYPDTRGLVDENGIIYIEKFTALLEILSREENAMVKSFYKTYSRKKYGESNRLSKMESEIRRIEFLPLVKRVHDTVHFNQENWEERYYQRYLCSSTIGKSDIDNMCKNYCEGLIWSYQYYIKGCNSWLWYYKYPCAPTTKDLYSYFQRKLFSNNLFFENNKPLQPVQQLLCILPPSSSYLIPERERVLMTSNDSIVRDLFPDSFNIEMLYMRYFHESIPQLPRIDVNRILEAQSLL